MKDFFNSTVERLVAAGIPSPRMEARIIFEYVTGKENSWYETIEPEQKAQIMNLLERRCAHEPLDKIIGYKEFYKFCFAVSKDVLSPRPDSEVLVEKALELARRYGLRHIFEFGTGSGCLLLSILADLPEADGLGIDKSEKALEIAGYNSRVLKLDGRVCFRLADYMQEKPGGKYDIIIANPPYIPSADINKLQQEVKDYDPLIALDGGADGLDHYRRLAQIVPEMLQDSGYVLLEAGIGQAGKIAEIFCEQGLFLEEKCCDLGGIERCIIFKK